MELRSAAEFMEVAAQEGVGSGKYPHSPHLGFDSGADDMRFWTAPETIHEGTRLATALLASAGSWDEIWMHPAATWGGGCAPGFAEPWHELLRSHGVSPESRHAVRFTGAESATASALLAAEITVGQTRLCDLRILFRASDLFLYVEHHGVVWAHTRTPEAMDRVVAEMAGLGFPLPTDYPDDTFKPVSWIPSQPEPTD